MIKHLLDLRQHSSNTSSFLCYYINKSPKMQIARITNVPDWYFERVIFPRERLLFSAPATAQLEIYTYERANTVLCEKIPCDHLRVQQKEMKSN